ncbi:MAG: CAP domain-containing protein [Lachnospiraceae bacterium]|nr:CAP domain-containing protein [Lachnospiraceae bacterium]
MKRLCVVVLSIILLATLAPMAISSIHAGANNEGRKSQQELILELQNAYRVQAGMQPLTLTAELQTAADIRVEEAARYFSHTRPDGSAWWTVDPVTVYGENLSHGYDSAERIVGAWMASRDHRYNVMNPEYTTCGIDLTYVNGKWYCAQEFGY